VTGAAGVAAAAVAATAGAASATFAEGTDLSVAPRIDEPVSTPRYEPTPTAPVAEARPAPLEHHAEPVRYAPSPEVPAEAPRAEPAPVASRPEPVAMPAPAPVDLRRTAEESGLVWIETDPSKAKPVPEEISEVQPRGRRERRPPPAGLDEPLEQVETRKP
jgi:hypothetical protein